MGVRFRKQLKKQAGTDSDKPKRKECNKNYTKRNALHAHRPPFQAQIEPISYPFRFAKTSKINSIVPYKKALQS